MKTYLRSGDDPVESAQPFHTKAAAIRHFQRDAEELANYGQRHEASLHIADHLDQVVEYPDFVLSLGPRGGVRVEKV